MAITGSTALGDGRELITVSHDPQSVATDTLSGSLIVRESNGFLYRKVDNGSTTNVALLLDAAGGALPTVNEASATGDTTTTSSMDALVSGMTVTPGAGNYLVIFSGSMGNSQNNEVSEMSIYANGVQVAVSERRVNHGDSDSATPFCCAAVVSSLGAGQAIEGRWRTSANTATMHERTLEVITIA